MNQLRATQERRPARRLARAPTAAVPLAAMPRVTPAPALPVLRRACACGGGCAACGAGGGIRVGAANDPAEQEADRVADAVMRMPAAPSRPAAAAEAADAQTLQRQPVEEEEQELQPQRLGEGELRRQPEEEEEEEELQPQRLGEGELRRQPLEEEEEELQPRRARAGLPAAGGSLDAASVRGVREATAGGQPLAREVRDWFEPRLGSSLAGVRVHTGEGAARSAAGLGARAYTLGRDIVFGAGEYAPQSQRGRRLIAHELAHVAQGAARPRRPGGR